MKSVLYAPIIKASAAEMRAIENLTDSCKDAITPVFELTRSRKSKNAQQGDIYRRLDHLNEIYGNRRFILDLTSDRNLINEQIRKLQDNNNGYENWVKFISLLKDDYNDLVPAIQINDLGVKNEAELYEKVQRQVRQFDNRLELVVYRLPLEYEYYESDLRHISNSISHSKVFCIIDAGFISQGKSSIYAAKARDVTKVVKKYNIDNIAISATSFPRNPIQYGNDENGEWNLEECLFYEEMEKDKPKAKYIYSDYATIYPIRSDQAGGNGWVPRIDMPTEKTLYYYRSRRRDNELTYFNAYVRVARKVVSDQKFKITKKMIKNCWGIEQIELAAEGTPGGLSPSFWISVRMNIHISLRNMLSI